MQHSFILQYLLFFQAFSLLFALLAYLGLIIYKVKPILSIFRRIPLWLWFFNTALLLYKLFLIPHWFSSRGDYGSWILESMSREGPGWMDRLAGWKTPVYSFILKFFSEILGGIDFIFAVNLNIFLSYVNVFCIFILAWILSKDKVVAGVSALFYAISPVIFIFSQTEDYTNPSIFFAIQAMFFGSLFVYYKKYSFLVIGIAASLLAAGCRLEYVVFFAVFVLFLWIFIKKQTKKDFWFLLIIYLLIILPRSLSAINFFFFSDTGLGDRPVHAGQSLNSSVELFLVHWGIFVDNFSRNTLALFDIKTLTMVLSVFSIIAFSCFYFKKHRKITIFFFLYFIIFFFLYAFFHDEGVVRYKYLSSLVLPLCFLSAFGFKKVYTVLPKLVSVILLILISFYAFYATSFAFENKFNFRRYGRDSYSDPIYREYLLFQKLEAEIKADDKNFLASIINPLDGRNEKEQERVFLSNGRESLFYSAIAIKPSQIYKIEDFGVSGDFLGQKIRRLARNKIVYVSQGVMSLMRPDGSGTRGGCVDPDKFEKIIKEVLHLDEIVFSYDFKGQKVFLYKMSLKEE